MRRAAAPTCVSVFFRWCKQKGYLRDDPTPTLDRNRGREKRSVREFLTEDQFDELLTTIEADAILQPAISNGNRWLTDVIRFTVGTGLRRGEICNLRWSAINLHSGFVFVKNIQGTENAAAFSTKTGEERAVPLVGNARVVIERLQTERNGEGDDYVFKGMRGSQLNGEHLSKRFRHYWRMARLPKAIRFHSLRHTFASWWVLRGGDIYRLKEVLGHADVQTTMIYAHLRPDALREEMEKCFGSRSSAAAVPSELEELRATIAELREENSRLRRTIPV